MYTSIWNRVEIPIGENGVIILKKKNYPTIQTNSKKILKKQYLYKISTGVIVGGDLCFDRNVGEKPNFNAVYTENSKRPNEKIKKKKERYSFGKFFRGGEGNSGFVFLADFFRNGKFRSWKFREKQYQLTKKKIQCVFSIIGKKIIKSSGKNFFDFFLRKLLKMKNGKNSPFGVGNSRNLTKILENSKKIQTKKGSCYLYIIKAKKKFFKNCLDSLYASFSETKFPRKFSQCCLPIFQVGNQTKFFQNEIFFFTKEPYIISRKLSVLNQENYIILIKCSDISFPHFLETAQARIIFQIKSFQNSNVREFLKMKFLVIRRISYEKIKPGNILFNCPKRKILKKFKKLFYWCNLWAKNFFFLKKSFYLSKQKNFFINFRKLLIFSKKDKIYPTKRFLVETFLDLNERRIGLKIKYFVEKYPDRSIFWVRTLALQKIFNIKNINKMMGLWVQKDYLSQRAKLAYFILNLLELLKGNPSMEIKFSPGGRIEREMKKTFNILSKKIPSEIEKFFSFHEGNMNAFLDLEVIANFFSNGFRDLARKFILKAIFYSHGGNFHDSLIFFWIRMETGGEIAAFSEFLLESIKKKNSKNLLRGVFSHTEKIKNAQWKSVFRLLKNSYKTRLFPLYLKSIGDTLLKRHHRTIETG